MSPTKEDMPFEELIDKVIPYSGFTVDQIEEMAKGDLAEERPFLLIYRTREVLCSVESVQKYFDEKAKSEHFVAETPAPEPKPKAREKAAKF